MVMVINASKRSLLAGRAQRLNGPWGGLTSLINHSELYPGQGLIVDGDLMKAAKTVGTRFLRYPMDVVFADRHGLVIATAAGIKPFAHLPVPPGTAMVLKLPAGTIGISSTAVGDQVDVVDDKETAAERADAGITAANANAETAG